MADQKFFSLDQLSSLPPPVWLVEGMFEIGAVVMLSGPPGSMKSFMALDWMLSIAAGKSWNGKRTVESKVLYVLGEGRASLLKRAQAWAAYHRLDGAATKTLGDNFRVTFDVPQLAVKSSVDNMLFALEAEKFKPQVVVIDTLSRSFVGFDENSQKDAGMWVDSAERLRNLGMTVIFLHHTNKNTEFGHKYRGSSVLQGAIDSGFVMWKEGKKRIIFTTSKQKDHEEGDPLHFEVVSLSPDPNEEGSCVLRPTILMDERFTEEGQKIDKVVDDLIEDPTFESDRARGRELARQFGMTESAGQSRVKRRKDELGVASVHHPASVDASVNLPEKQWEFARKN